MQQICGDEKSQSQKIQHKHRDLCEKSERKKSQRGRDSTIIMVNTMVSLVC